MKKLPIALLVFGAWIGSLVAEAGDRLEPATQIDLDIPAQSLDSALTKFAAQTGVQLLYDSRLALSRNSSEVRGRLSVNEALTKLLTGTGLIPRFTADRAITLVLEHDDDVVALDTLHVDAQVIIGGKASWEPYARLLQSAVTTALKSGGAGSHERFRVSMRLWIDEKGSVKQIELADSTGDPRIDREIATRLQGLSLDQPPPKGMPQPVRIRVNAQTVTEGS